MTLIANLSRRIVSRALSFMQLALLKCTFVFFPHNRLTRQPRQTYLSRNNVSVLASKLFFVFVTRCAVIISCLACQHILLPVLRPSVLFTSHCGCFRTVLSQLFWIVVYAINANQDTHLSLTALTSTSFLRIKSLLRSIAAAYAL